MDTALILVSLISASSAFRYFEPEMLKPCPRVLPFTDFPIQQLKGRWHLSLLILDAATENLEESGVCVTGQITVHNSTFMKQAWDMYSPGNMDDPVGNIEFAVSVIRPGVWSVQTPLGAQLSATMFGLNEDCIMVVHCGWHKGSLVHLWTAGVTRDNNLPPSLRIKLSSLLLDNGFDPTSTKIITWNKTC